MPFLTDLDSRAEVKGSRDPLGLMAIWAHFGRKVVGNLTTVTSSVRGFTTLLLGLHLAELLQETAADDRPSTLEVFLKFEQLAGYARVKFNDDSSVRGWRRVKARVSSARIRISAASDHQILSNQKVYGLWGLYTMPARASEMLLPREARLTDEARAFVESQYRGVISKRLLDLLRRDWFDFEPDGRDTELARRIAEAHGPIRDSEKTFYRDHLAWGGPVDTTGGKQRQLAELVSRHDVQPFTYREFRAVRSLASRRSDHQPLFESLEQIDAVEHLINPARVAFGFLLTRNGQPLAEVAKEIERTWRRPPAIREDLLVVIRPEIARASWDQAAARWMDLAASLRDGDYLTYLQKLIEANTDVMQKRNGSAAWLTVENGLLRIRMADETESLRSAAEVEDLWRSTYFINALHAVTQEIGA